jgi:calcineurin-like phosphoesterase family protein
MNDKLIANWNSTVRDGDTVFFLGDLAFGVDRKTFEYYDSILNGKKIYIYSDDDIRLGYMRKGSNVVRQYTFKIYRFTTYVLLIHNPDAVVKWRSWVMHGHFHNNNMQTFPFVNGIRKTINVSADVVNFKPVSIDFIANIDLNTIIRMETTNSRIERW